MRPVQTKTSQTNLQTYIISHMQAIKQFQQVQTTINTSKHPFKSNTKMKCENQIY